MNSASDTHWKQRPEGGGLFALWLIRTFALHVGRLPSRLLLFPITLYFLLVRGPERRASRAFLARVFGRPATLWEVARHIHTFAATILDRVFLLSEQFRHYQLQVHGLDALHAEIDKGRGVLLFGAHVGSFEALRVLSLKRPDVSVRVVLDKGQSPAITQLLDALNPNIASTVIDAAQPGTAIVLAIKEAAEQKAVIGLLVDRAKSGDLSLACPFFGAPALFPAAPALIAAALQIPVVLCFGLYRGHNRYDVHFETFSEGLSIPRNNRRDALADVLTRYAARLEHYVRLAPYNWFNFYDFWNINGQAAHAPIEQPASSARSTATSRVATAADVAAVRGSAAGRGGGA
jgi:predicted LPLAT superfamily acyltransferase